MSRSAYTVEGHSSGGYVMDGTLYFSDRRIMCGWAVGGGVTMVTSLVHLTRTGDRTPPPPVMQNFRGQFDIPMSHFSERFWFHTVFIPKGFYSEMSFLRAVFSPLIRKAYNPKGHCSEKFNSEMPLFRTVFMTKGFWSERFLIPKGRFSEIRNRNLSDQKPFGSKT